MKEGKKCYISLLYLSFHFTQILSRALRPGEERPLSLVCHLECPTLPSSLVKQSMGPSQQPSTAQSSLLATPTPPCTDCVGLIGEFTTLRAALNVRWLEDSHLAF